MTEIDVNIHPEPTFFAGVISGRTSSGPYCRLAIQASENNYGGLKIFTDAAGLAKIRDAIDEHLSSAEADEAVEVVSV